jgi:MinD superfamily P-loop ATPase
MISIKYQMKEITVLSGKGGTGKTTITAALAAVAKNAVFCDNDVDAADLHLILNPAIKETNNFFSGWKAIINNAECTRCDICIRYCRFDAIHPAL